MGKFAEANNLCPCGSGKKYKKCCLKTASANDELFKLIHETLSILDIERSELNRRVNLIEELISKNKLSDSELRNVYLNIYQLYILQGQDQKALDIIDNSINIDSLETAGKISVLINKIKILLNLGSGIEALQEINLVKDMVHALDWSDKLNKSVKSSSLIEIGKSLTILSIFYSNETGNNADYSEAIEIFDELIENYELNNYNDIDHYLGAKSNKAALLLRSESEDTQNQGIEQMLQIIDEKIKCGYIVGVANSYCNLGLYYLKKKDYKQAIAYTKRDLQITKRFGTLREEISTLLNLSDIYIALRQISNARATVREAMQIAEQTRNTSLAIFISEKIKKIDKIAKELNLNGKTMGPKSECECGSGKTFEECCGEADFDYDDIGKVLGLDHIIPYSKTIDDSIKQSLTKSKDRLGLILRKLSENEIRLSWVEVIHNGALQEIYELPDMANIYLLSAKSLVSNIEYKDMLQEISISLSAALLSVSALEAFLNQLIYFLATIPSDELPEFICEKIPGELIADYTEYQRTARFTDKINVIASIFCNGKWSSEVGMFYNDLFKLISIRNELVHFKSVEYLKIIPPQKDAGILKNLSSEVKLRDISNSWPLRILNMTFAQWSIKTIEQTINYIKDTYKSCIDS